MLAGFAVAVVPQIFPWRSGTLIPSEAILEVGAVEALFLLAVGLTCCLIWPAWISRRAPLWATGTMIGTWVYLILSTNNLVSCWIGAAIATLAFVIWDRCLPLARRPS